MKTRSGFVSNSSSSSFIVATAEGVDAAERLKQDIFSKIYTSEAASVFGPLADMFVRILTRDGMTVEEYIDDYYSDASEFYENFPVVKDLEQRGLTVNIVKVSNQDCCDLDGVAEMLLYMYPVEYVSKDLVVTQLY